MRPDATRLTGQQHRKAWIGSLRLLLMAGLALTVAEESDGLPWRSKYSSQPAPISRSPLMWLGRQQH